VAPTMDELIAEAERQLRICNSCRYCEGYCAVFPALERRTVLEAGDITSLANLCHDCRACFYACMYAPPHEFAVNPPEILSRVRAATYQAYVPSPPLPAWLRGRSARVSAAVGVGAALLALVALTEGIDALFRHGGPYQLISYPALLVTVALPTAWSVAVMLRATARYWHDTHGPLRELADRAAWARAVAYAGRLAYLRGGGGDCYYPGADPSPARRRLHAAVFYGFAACFAATLAAAFMQDILGIPPPYPLLSAPVILGTAGGLGMITGCAGLFVLARRSDPAPGAALGLPPERTPDEARDETRDETRSAADYGLLVGLGLLAATGLLTLLLRATPAYGLVLIAHLATIVVCFCIAPYTRFAHSVYRVLAIVADNIEAARAR
jgi:citrate/tricarballylate utilization protein